MARIFRRYESTIYGNYRKAYLIDGALTGVVMSVVMLLRDWLAKSPMPSPENYITELVLAVGIFWSSYQYRKQLPEGKVTLKELMLLGLGIGVVSAVVYGLWTWLRCGVLNTSLVDYYNHQRINMMEAQVGRGTGDKIHRWRLGFYRSLPLGGNECDYHLLCLLDISNRESPCPHNRKSKK